MKNKPFFLIILFIGFYLHATVQPKKHTLDSLEQQVTLSNDKMKYNNSLQLIVHFLKDQTITSYDRCHVWFLKSYTHKRLFDYPEALRSLDSAYADGMRSNRKEELIANIKAEKAYIYFDTQKYVKAAHIMQELKDTNYKYISAGDKSNITMQYGYIAFLNGDYAKAETNYDAAIALMQIDTERNLPMIYGKKVELYGMMHLPKKRDEALTMGLKIAEKYNILKYKVYMYESLHLQFVKNNDYKNAYFANLKLDSLRTLYNAEQNKYSLKLSEQKLEVFEKDQSIIHKNHLLWFLGSIAVCLILIISLIYYLLLSRKNAHQLLEADYKRIFDELYLLTANISSEKSNSLTDLSKYNLSVRQREVIDLLKYGRSNKQIAEVLFISENTVKYHLKSIYDILKIENRNEFYRLIK